MSEEHKSTGVITFSSELSRDGPARVIQGNPIIWFDHDAMSNSAQAGVIFCRSTPYSTFDLPCNKVTRAYSDYDKFYERIVEGNRLRSYIVEEDLQEQDSENTIVTFYDNYAQKYRVRCYIDKTTNKVHPPK